LPIAGPKACPSAELPLPSGGVPADFLVRTAPAQQINLVRGNLVDLS